MKLEDTAPPTPGQDDACPFPLLLLSTAPHVYELTVNVALAAPPLLSVYVIVAEPGACAVTRPVELTVATVVLLDTHGELAAAVLVPDN